MSKKHWIYIKRGLSEDPKHRAAMGECVWLYMHIIDRADWETGIAFDWKDKEEAADMSLPLDTLRRQRQKLEEGDYIRCFQKQYSQEIKIMEWRNPRDYGCEVKNPRNQGMDETPPSETQGLNQGLNQGIAQVETPTSDSKSKSILGIENKIFAGLPVTEDDLQNDKIKSEAITMFEAAYGISNSWPWWSGKEWTRFSQWVVEQYQIDRFSFGNYIVWRATPYVKGAMSNVQIRRNPELFYDSWDMFVASKPKDTDFVDLL